MSHPATVLTLLAVLLTAGCGVTGQADGSDQVSAPGALSTLAAGTPLPEATLPDLHGGETLHVPSDLTGQPAVLNFWATWCAFCVEEMPDLEEVHQQLEGRVAFVGIDQDDDVDKARTLADRTAVTYRLVIDDDGSYFRAVQGRGMPTTVLVTSDGTIAHRHSGPLDAEQLRDLLQEHLGVDVAAPGPTS